MHRNRLGLAMAVMVCTGIGVEPVSAAGLRIGAAKADITPEKPVALAGQFYTRISRGVDTPIVATAVALEAYEGDRSVDQAILLSCDLLWIQPPLPQRLRDRLKDRLPEFDSRKLVMTATHTHTAPVTGAGNPAPAQDGVMTPAEYTEFLIGRLADVCVRAWQQRQPGGVSWGLGYAATGRNRRAVYADGTARMYGATTDPAFRGIEGGEDHGLELLFFWDSKTNLIATAVNVACPSQVGEHRSSIGADFWHDVRERLPGGLILGWPGACGDLSPHPLYRQAAEERMLTLRGLTRTQELGRRLALEIRDIRDITRNDIRTDVVFAHTVEDLALPVRQVTEQDAAAAQKAIEEQKKKGGDRRRQIAWLQKTIDRHKAPKEEPPITVRVHILRIGDIAIATNPFELFQDYGVQIKARSRAVQTFVIELTDGARQYLPTPRAVANGGYGATLESSPVGPEGGQMLVERTVEMINALWPAAEHPATPAGTADSIAGKTAPERVNP